MAMTPVPAPRGRPRTFDLEEALDRAMLVFWRKGFEGASLTALTRAMGINRPSLYAAFGDKEALFRKVLDRYERGPAAYFREALRQPTARAFAERFLQGAAELQTNPGTPPGCLLVQGGLASGETTASIRKELDRRRALGDALILARLERARAEGDLPPEANPADLAQYLAAIVRGMAVQAAGGATREKLEGVIRTALRVWPQESPQ